MRQLLPAVLAAFLSVGAAHAQQWGLVGETPFANGGSQTGGGGGSPPAGFPVAGAFTNVTTTALTANWTAGSPVGTSYSCILSTGAFPNSDAGNVTQSGAGLSQTFTGLTPNTQYFAKVNATNAVGSSGYTSLGSTTTATAASDPLDASFIPNLTNTTPSWICGSDISTKVWQNTPNASCSDSWANPNVIVAGARNEVVYVQMHIINAPIALSNVSAKFSNLTHSEWGVQLTTDTPTNLGVLTVNVTTYTFISTATTRGAAGNTSYITQENYELPTTFMPDVDPDFQQRTNVMPLSVAQGNNQSFMAEFRIPTGIAAGYYGFNIYWSTGSSAANATVIGVQKGYLAVIDSTMSATSGIISYKGLGYNDLAVQTWGSNTTGNRFGIATPDSDTGAQLIAQYEAEWLLSRKFSAGQINVGAWPFSTLQPIFDNLLGGAPNGTYRNPRIPGAKLTMVQPGSIGSSSFATASSWVSGYTSNGYTNDIKHPIIAYNCDEPSGGTWAGTCFPSQTGVSGAGTFNLITQNITNVTIQGSSGTLNVMITIIEDFTSTNKTNSATWVSNSPTTRSWGMYSDCESGSNASIGGSPNPGDGTGPCLGTKNGGSAVGAGNSLPAPHDDAYPAANFADFGVIMANANTGHLTSTISQCWATSTGCGQTIGIDSMWKPGGRQYDGNGDENGAMPGTPTQIGVSTPIILGTFPLIIQSYGIQVTDLYNNLVSNGQSTEAANALATWYTNETTFNMNALAATGSFTGSIASFNHRILCDNHKLKWGSSSCSF